MGQENEQLGEDLTDDRVIDRIESAQWKVRLGAFK